MESGQVQPLPCRYLVMLMFHDTVSVDVDFWHGSYAVVFEIGKDGVSFVNTF